ncbi:anaerobic dimethyl sulfoxide reductase subunit C [Klebsiella pneumoniae]|nr:anaerobic dimethyl sulfoxide reductase subunit C [Klebsiella pneumoniae]
MGNGWHEWPLVLFTVLGQCVVGATIVSGLGWLALEDQREARRRLVRNMFFIWLLMGIGFLASVMHLGSPLRAFNSLNRIGASALSNEIASGALFFAVGGFWWLLAVLEKMPATLGKVWLAIAHAVRAAVCPRNDPGLPNQYRANMVQWLHHQRVLSDGAPQRAAVCRPAAAAGESRL